MRKFLSVFLAFLLVLSVFAGCASDPTSESTTPSSQPSTAPSNSTAPDDTPQTGLPLTEEKVTFSAWWPLSGTLASYLTSFNDVKCIIELENRTNIHIDFEHPSQGTEQESFNLMMSSQSLRDLISDYGYIGGIEKAVEDEVYLRLNDYLGEYMPNYSAIRDADINVFRDTMTDNGYIASVYGLWDTPEPPWCGLMVREDWLNDLNMDAPVTYDDWDIMLEAFKNEKGADSALLLDSNANFMFGELSAGYGVNMSFFQKDGKVHYSPVEEGYKKYVTTLADWYSRGLVQKDFYNQSIWATATSLGMTDRAGVIWGVPELSGNNYVKLGIATDPNLTYLPVLNPKENAADGHTHFRCNTYRTRSAFSVSTQCVIPELLLRWLDYGYSEEGSMLWSFGVEGESLEFIDGKPQYTDLVVNNPELEFNTNRFLYCMNVGPFLGHAYRFTRHTTGDAFAEQQVNTLNAQSVWVQGEIDYIIPPTVALTAEEGTEYANIFQDIETYVMERTLSIITGQESIDTWDSVVAQIKTMNIDRAIKLRQAAFDRYLNRD